MAELQHMSARSLDRESSAPRFSNRDMGRGFGHRNTETREKDAIVVLMGLTGSGKSTFISKLVEQPVQVGDTLESCTVDIGTYSFRYDEKRTVFLIDTPGFDDTSRSDTEVLKDIAFFLATVYKQKAHLAGIVYLHRITDPRMQGGALKNLQMLRKICGDSGLPSVVLATTMWAQLDMTGEDREAGYRREEELRRPEFWGELIRSGSQMTRHDGTPKSARDIVATLVERAESSSAVLDIQVQMVERELTLDQTAAGRHLQKDVLEARRKYEAELAEYRASMELALQEKDAETLEDLRLGKEALRDQERQRVEDQQRLVVSLEQLTREKGLQYRDYAEMLSRQRQQRRSAGTGSAGASQIPTPWQSNNDTYRQGFSREMETAGLRELDSSQIVPMQAIAGSAQGARRRRASLPFILGLVCRLFGYWEDELGDAEDRHAPQQQRRRYGAGRASGY